MLNMQLFSVNFNTYVIYYQNARNYVNSLKPGSSLYPRSAANLSMSYARSNVYSPARIAIVNLRRTICRQGGNGVWILNVRKIYNNRACRVYLPYRIIYIGIKKNSPCSAAAPLNRKRAANICLVYVIKLHGFAAGGYGKIVEIRNGRI